ncbi:MAG: S41 family peptidase [Proteobacteria bacterium]|nr:S41 family peptidase [Pseudomonadota bacterium]
MFRAPRHGAGCCPGRGLRDPCARATPENNPLKVIEIVLRFRLRHVLIALFALLSIFTAVVRAAPAEPLSTATLDGLESFVQTVQRESIYDPSTTSLVQGASRALRRWLDRQGVEVESPPASSIDSLREEFEAVLAAHPGLSRADLYHTVMRGLLEPLEEPYTRFLSPLEFSHLRARIDGSDECGLGCHLELDGEHRLVVAETFEGAPATRAGLAVGDVLLDADGRPLGGLSLTAAKELLCGPSGSRVRLTVARPQRTFHADVIRSQTELPTITARMLDEHVGYLRLRAFSADLARRLDTALEALQHKGATAYVIDLRDNRGGFVSSAVDACSRLLPPGTRVMSLRQKRRPEVAYTTYDTPRSTSAAPLVVLVNERSASASEIMAGCLQDHHAAVLVGTRTYGKGLVQKLFPLPDGSAFAISTGRYLTPAGRDLHRNGIVPDVRMEQRRYCDVGSDPLVREALARLHVERASAHPRPQT